MLPSTRERSVNLKRVTMFGAAGGALAVWLAAAATAPARQPAPIPAPKAKAVDASGAKLAVEVMRLRERIRPVATPLHSRDLFHFAGAPVRQHARAAAPAAAVEPDSTVVSAAVEPLKLVGLAEDNRAGLERTAIVSGFGQLFIVKEQEAVTDRYRVQRISSEAVELLDLTNQTTLRLVLK